MKKLLVPAAVLSASAIPLIAVATPASATVAPHISCTYNRLAQINATPGLKVHTTPNGSHVLGLFPNNETIEYCATPNTITGGYTWVWAAGNLTDGSSAQGYVATAYLDHISVIH